MRIGRPLLASLGIVAAMAALSAFAAPRLPPGQRLPVHWGLDGADRFAPAVQALAAGPVTAAALTLLFAVLPAMMPRKGRLDRSAGAYAAAWLGVIGLVGVIHAGVVAAALGAPLDPARLVPGAIGALLLGLGNLLGKVRYNYVFGVRTPWTLASERVWDRTHRFMGPVTMLWGALVVAAAAEGDGRWARLALVAGAGAVTGLALAYSYREARRAGEA